MKVNVLKKVSAWLLTAALLVSTTVFASAETEEQWVPKAPMSAERIEFQVKVVDGKIYAFGGFLPNVSSPTPSVEEYDPATDQWTPKKSMSVGRALFCAEEVGGKIYVLGGMSDPKTIPPLEEYDPATDTWTTKASPMANLGTEFQTEVIDGKIYAIGGYNGNVVSSVEEYDPATNVWTVKAPMSVPRYEFQTAVINGKIYAIGGTDNKTTFSSVEEYDPSKNVWATKASMSSPRCAFRTEAIDGKIYAIGGSDGPALQSSRYLSSVEEYDPATNVWTAKASMPFPRAYFQEQAVNGNSYIIGGLGSTGGYSSVEEYNPSADKWTEKPSMATTRIDFQPAVVGNNIYVIGGRKGYNASDPFLSTVEAYNTGSTAPTLTVTASPNKVRVGQQFTATVAIHNVSNIYAEDVRVTYDSSLFDYVGAKAKDGIKIYKEDTSTPGTVRLIIAHLGEANAANGDKDLVDLGFKAKAKGTGKVDIIKGRIADNATLEEDVADENCGEDTITVEGGDVNYSGEYTLLDLGIDAGYYGKDASQTDSTKFDADQVANGEIDDDDLAEITKDILANTNYGPNGIN